MLHVQTTKSEQNACIKGSLQQKQTCVNPIAAVFIIIGFLINTQVYGHHKHPGSWFAACMADLTPDLQVSLS